MGGVFKSGAVMGAKTEKRSWLVSLLLSLPLPSSGRGRLGRASLGRWGGCLCAAPCAGLGWSALGGPGPLGPPAWVAPPVGASLVGVVLPPLSWGRPLGPPPWGPWGVGFTK